MDADLSNRPEHRPERVSVTRRRFLQGAVATGALAATGGLLGELGSSTAAAATSAPVQKVRKGGNLSVGLTGGSGTDTLDPHQGLTYLDTARAQQLYQPLLQLNRNAQSELVLAEEISPNGSTSEWIIRLKPGIHFHSGKLLGADDVIYTLRRILNPKKPLSGATSLGPIDLNGLKKLDARTVKVPMKHPYGSFVDQLSYWYYLYIVPDGYVHTQKPNGTGPFVYKSFTPGPRSVFTRNDNYWKSGLPHLDSVTIIDFQDGASMQNALVTNVIDGAGALEGPQLKVLAKTGGVKTVASQTGAMTPFTMRVDKAPFNNINVRQALRLLVNRPQLIEIALDGFAFAGSDVSSPYDPDFDHALHRQLDIPQAKHLLKKAGHENLTVSLTTSAVATGTVAMATVLKQQAQAAGVTINLNLVDPTTFFSPGVYLSSAFSQDFWNYSPYLAQVAQSFLPTSPFNETHTNNPKYTRLYNQANETLNTAIRRQIEHEMQVIDFTEGGYIVPCFIDALDAYSDKITGYSAAKVGQPLSDFDFEHFAFLS